MGDKEIGRGTFNDALELCDEIMRLSKLVGDPIAYIEGHDSTIFGTVILFEETLTDKSKAYYFRLEE